MPAGLALVVSIGCSPPGAPMSPVPVQPPPSDLRLGSPFEGELALEVRDELLGDEASVGFVSRVLLQAIG